MVGIAWSIEEGGADVNLHCRGRAEYRRIAQRPRRQWSDWQGEDSLHEMAFGGPDEEADDVRQCRAIKRDTWTRPIVVAGLGV